MSMNAVVIESQGPLSVMEYKSIAMPTLLNGQVRIAMRACSLNYHDIFTRRGMPGVRTPLPMILGCDCAGIIAEIGPGVVDNWKLGDRILCDPISRFRRKEDPDPKMPIKFIGDTRWGGYSEYCVVWDRQLIKIPDEIPLKIAACLPVAFGSSYRMVVEKGKVSKGEKVLILGASGGVGNCACQLAKARGAYVVGCASGMKKCQMLKDLFNVDETIDTTTENIVKRTRQLTGGSLLSGGGFDCVVNSQGGEWWSKGLRCLKQGGRMVANGALAGHDPPTDIRYIFQGELEIRGSNGWDHSDIINLVEMVRTGALKPHIGAEYPLEKGIEAHAALEARTHFGKIVITSNAPILGDGGDGNVSSKL